MQRARRSALLPDTAAKVMCKYSLLAADCMGPVGQVWASAFCDREECVSGSCSSSISSCTKTCRQTWPCTTRNCSWVSSIRKRRQVGVATVKTNKMKWSRNAIATTIPMVVSQQLLTTSALEGFDDGPIGALRRRALQQSTT